MSELKKYWVEEIYPTDAEDEIGIAGTKAVYLAADIEPVLLKHRRVHRLIRLLVDTGHRWDGYTLDYDEATRLLERLGD